MHSADGASRLEDQEYDRESQHVCENDPLGEFVCEREPELQNFLRNEALRWERGGFARTYLLKRAPTESDELPAILGYYTISMARVTVTDLPRAVCADQPTPIALPAALLGRLARDTRAPADLKIGELLVADALRRVLQVEAVIGCSFVVLDAMNERLVNYYQNTFGFVPLKRKDFPRKMVLTLDTIRMTADQ